MRHLVDPARARSDARYRAVWRWHFHAGIIVLPFLAWLAITGALYLYKPEIEQAVYRQWIEVRPRGEPLPLSRLIPLVERQAGPVSQVERPASPGESWRMLAGERTAFVDPYDGRVLGTVRKGGVMQRVRDLHSLILTGPVGNALIEVVAGWAVLLVLTGFWLWWPRGGNPALAVRGRPARRVFWRDLHASVGALAGTVVLFLALTGMPWTGFWGSALRGFVAEHELGRPAPPQADRSHADHAAAHTLPWSLQEAGMPQGGPDRIGPDRAAAIGGARGLAPPWVLSLPGRPGEPYLFAKAVRRAEEGRVLYIDAATGRVLQDARFAEFGAGARLIEWGIATHKGEEYGEANRLLMLLGCLSVLLLALSAAVMWWKRRPPGRFGAPPPHPDGGRARGVLAIMLGIGALFPLTGISMLAVLAADRAGRLAGAWLATNRR